MIECGPQATGGNFTDWQGVRAGTTWGCPSSKCRKTAVLS
ncbi:MAG: hypothetical protein JKY78_03335 [Hyphomonas sp.]|nr:hypothetical protein [Hyphomonas sp.]